MADQKHILVTNDDGIDSYFLRVLVDALVKDFRVTVAAPMGEKSWIGRAMSRNGEVHLAESENFPCRAFALDGTPSDCVNIALGHLLVDDMPDAVCSGINLGFNCMAPLIFSSGTVAGALEGAAWGLPALAFSHQVPDTVYETLRQNHGKAEGVLEDSLRAASDWARDFASQRLPEGQDGLIVHNYNFPSMTTAGALIEQTSLSPFKIKTLFKKSGPSSFDFQYNDGEPPETGTYDWACLVRGNISYTRLDFGRVGQMD
ncbi:5'/3'-nucleotidase SurE [Cerasicoccus arenae]|uniref:5'-nucleotidase n=1 Tax=Cerasicoccus arenae TaxID=424488 RepID=A0A8J3D990_9BACT|nr:5'/3'-nucleotidase SurE [Cerasicoccus arenae]MBK1858336.1 5'/3'-nucleotidase SurE [Cerasicoccus arenae]GHB90856.1 stationary phase survival protein SurE [Cerasicoccus arenae]